MNPPSALFQAAKMGKINQLTFLHHLDLSFSSSEQISVEQFFLLS